MLASLADHSELWWYVMRGSGLVAFLLLTTTAVLGIAGVRRWSRPRWSRAVIALVHRNVALLAVGFLAVHITTAVTDKYVSIPWYSSLIPLTSGYQTVWTAFGTVTLDLLLALVVTSLLRARIGRRAWRAVHWAAYAAWPAALVHGLTDGTDTGAWWTTALYLVAGGTTVAAVVWRATRGQQSSAGRPPRPVSPAGRPGPDAPRPGRPAAGAPVPVLVSSR
jgi:sulfoxide reductase heme-binding subunit YedZ